MRPKRDGVPMAASVDARVHYEAVPCVCGGHITGTTLPLWRQRWGGEVEYRCEDCGRLETPEERVTRVTAPKPPIALPCTRKGCRNTFTPTRSSGAPQIYCSTQCRTWAEGDRKRQSPIPRRLMAGLERLCEYKPCGQMFTIRGNAGPLPRYCSATCVKRASAERVARKREAA